MPYITPPPISPLVAPTPEKTQEKISSWSVFFAFLLAVTLVVLSEFIFIDTNKVFNPSYFICHQPEQSVGVDQCLPELYERRRVILNSEVILPIVITLLVVYFISRSRQLKSPSLIMGRTVLVVVIWLFLRQFYETARFLLRYHYTAGVYTILITLILLFIIMIIVVQRRNNRLVIEENKQLEEQRKKELEETVERSSDRASFDE